MSQNSLQVANLSLVSWHMATLCSMRNPIAVSLNVNMVKMKADSRELRVETLTFISIHRAPTQCDVF